MERTAHPHETLTLHAGDPLWNLLMKRLSLSLPIVVVLIVAVTVVCILGIGAVVSYWVYPQPNLDIIRVFDPDHLYFALVVLFVYSPSVWFIYLWQPRGMATTLHLLRQNDVIVETKERSLEASIKRMNSILNSPFLLTAIIVAMLIVLLLESFVAVPGEAAARGKTFFWYYDKRYYLLVFVPISYVTLYVAFMVVAKGILALGWFNLLFRRFHARVHPLHVDGVGGFGPLGSLAIRYSLIAVSLGVIGTSLTVARVFADGGWMLVESLLFYVAYAVLTPACLITPLWSAHQAMVHCRNKLLDDISNEFERALVEESPKNAAAFKESGKRLLVLRARYSLVRDTYPTWPLSLTAFRGFGITASLPLAVSIISTVVDLVTR